MEHVAGQTDRHVRGDDRSVCGGGGDDLSDVTRRQTVVMLRRSLLLSHLLISLEVGNENLVFVCWLWDISKS